MVEDSDAQLNVPSFAAAFVQLSQAVARAAPPDDTVSRLLSEHLGTDAGELPMVSMPVETFDQANLQRALDAFRSDPDIATIRMVGVRGQGRMFPNLTLATMTAPGAGVELGPVDYVERPIGIDATLTCIDFALLLLRVGSEPTVMLVRNGDPRFGGSGLAVDVMNRSRDRASEILHTLRTLMAEHNVFRHQVVALEPAGMMGTALTARFLPRPSLTRDDVILPDGVLERIERLTIDFSARARSMRAGGRHLRRGILLHGAPGTGKTHTIRYLMSALAERSVFVLSGNGFAIVGKTVAIARAVQPSIVVLEDVDLVAEERTRPHAGTNPVLFELLNHMDGVEDDADLVFLLTTNRPDLLEPALAARPGRVDLAIEVPLPAAPERERLLALYSRGLDATSVDWNETVSRTDGVSAAFLRELVRQTALEGAATHDDAAPVLTEHALLATLADLSHASQAMTARLLGSTI